MGFELIGHQKNSLGTFKEVKQKALEEEVKNVQGLIEEEKYKKKGLEVERDNLQEMLDSRLAFLEQYEKEDKDPLSKRMSDRGYYVFLEEKQRIETDAENIAKEIDKFEDNLDKVNGRITRLIKSLEGLETDLEGNMAEGSE